MSLVLAAPHPPPRCQRTVAPAFAQRMREMWSKELAKDEPNLDIKFQYALLLIKSRSQDLNREGMALLQGS